jgi:hypothetical protein
MQRCEFVRYVPGQRAQVRVRQFAFQGGKQRFHAAGPLVGVLSIR